MGFMPTLAWPDRIMAPLPCNGSRPDPSHYQSTAPDIVRGLFALRTMFTPLTDSLTAGVARFCLGNPTGS